MSSKRSQEYCQFLHRSRPKVATRAMEFGDNKLSLCDDCWELLKGKGVNYEIVHFDPSDLEEGLKAVDREGRQVPKENLTFYRLKQIDKAEEEFSHLKEALNRIREELWQVAFTLEWFWNNPEMISLLGCQDWNELVNEIGIESKITKRYRRAVTWLRDYCKQEDLDWNFIHNITSKYSPEEIEQARKLSSHEREKQFPEFAFKRVVP